MKRPRIDKLPAIIVVALAACLMVAGTMDQIKVFVFVAFLLGLTLGLPEPVALIGSAVAVLYAIAWLMERFPAFSSVLGAVTACVLGAVIIYVFYKVGPLDGLFGGGGEDDGGDGRNGRNGRRL